MTREDLSKKNLSILDFINLFTEDYCKEYLLKTISSYGTVFCPFCGSENPYDCKKRYRCSQKECRKDFRLKGFTIFKNCNLTLSQLFFIIYQNSLNRKNISSVQYSYNIGVSQKTAWSILNKIRYSYYQDEKKLSGIIEVDEAFVSKLPRGTHPTNWGGISTRKAPIFGLIERGGRVICLEIPNRKRDTIIEIIEKYVEKGSTIYTDGYAGYKILDKIGYKHNFVEHSTREYVRGDVHTNSIEGFWSHFKKSIRNAHHSISNKHIQAYINEAVFKYNNRHLSQMEKFNLILKQCII